MTLEYTEVSDPNYSMVRKTCIVPDHVLVRSKTSSNVPFHGSFKDQAPYFMARSYQNAGQRIKDLQVRKDDVWVVSHPKSGTTWVSEMVWLICNDLNYDLTREAWLQERVLFLERSVFSDEDSLTAFEEMPSPRFVKTHIPASLLPDMMWTVKPKIVYVHRNVKSVAVSYFHHHQTLAGFRGSMDQFVLLFSKHLVPFSPYHQHVLEFNALSHLDNVLLISFEEMKKDLKAVIFKVGSFFGKSYSENQVEKLCQHLSFESMKNNPSVNRDHISESNIVRTVRFHEKNYVSRKLMRKGEVDGWKRELSEELVNLIDKWTRNTVMGDDELKMFM